MTVLEMIEAFNDFNGKRVLVTGAAGTVGGEVLKQLSHCAAREVVGLDNNEAALFHAASSTQLEFRPVLADVRDSSALGKVFPGIDVVIHLAALKHVGFSEGRPMEAVKTNVLAVITLIDCAISADVESVVNTSTDKAVNPFSVMGTTKLMGEHLIRAANLVSTSTSFSSTRFGNVLGSSGSVVPIFRNQIENGASLTLTSRDMTRFVMTLEEAARLVLQSVSLSKGGETFITKMKTVRIADLARAMIQTLLGTRDEEAIEKKITEIGARPGEKYFEELMSSEEKRRCRELEEYFVIFPALTDVYGEHGQEERSLGQFDAYNSENQSPMTVEEIVKYLEEHQVL